MSTAAETSALDIDRIGRNRRAIWMFFSSIWVFFMVGGVFRYWRLPGDNIQYEPLNVGHKVLATLLVAGFIGVYLYTLYRTYYGRDSWFQIVSPGVSWLLRLVPMAILVLSLLLPNAQVTNWRQGFVFVVIIWALTSQPNQAISSVFQATAIAALLLIATDSTQGGITGSLLFSLGFGVMVAGYVMNNGLVGELMLERGKVRDQAVTEERFRLARDLHDTVGHSMTQITLKSELARRILSSDPSRAAAELEEIEQLSRELSREVRNSIAGNVALTLHSELDRARELLESVNISPSINNPAEEFSKEVDETLAWCLREGVMNVVKHSGASRCDISVEQDADQIILRIADNGNKQINDSHSGQGISGMKQRIVELDGRLEFKTTESGHILEITLPQ